VARNGAGPDRRALIERFAERLRRDRDREFGQALTQIARIARLRLEALLGDREGDLAPP